MSVRLGYFLKVAKTCHIATAAQTGRLRPFTIGLERLWYRILLHIARPTVTFPAAESQGYELSRVITQQSPNRESSLRSQLTQLEEILTGEYCKLRNIGGKGQSFENESETR